MRRRLIAMLGTLVVTLAMVTGPVAANTGTFGAGAWASGLSVNGGAYSPLTDCQTQHLIIPLAGNILDRRCAFEFDISGLPAGATITSATLSLFTTLDQQCVLAPSGCPTDATGYVGNGVGEMADLTSSGTGLGAMPTATFPGTYLNLGVTGFVTALYGNGDDWAGFLLSSNGITGSLIWLDPADENPPILTIEYTLPDASVAASLADAATTPPSPASPLATFGFGLLLISSLGVLAIANVRARSR